MQNRVNSKTDISEKLVNYTKIGNPIIIGEGGEGRYLARASIQVVLAAGSASTPTRMTFTDLDIKEKENDFTHLLNK